MRQTYLTQRCITLIAVLMLAACVSSSNSGDRDPTVVPAATLQQIAEATDNDESLPLELSSLQQQLESFAGDFDDPVALDNNQSVQQLLQ